MSGHSIVTFRNSVPGAQALAESIAHSPTIQALNQTVWAFSLVEISHLLLLTMLGGAVLVLSLRVLGLALSGVSVQDVERMTRPWLRIGTVGGIISGTFMSIATALTLVANGAFFIKILALVAAVLFSFALAGRIRQGVGSLGQTAQGLAGLAALLFSLWLFASTRGLNTGAILIGGITVPFVALVWISRSRVSADDRRDEIARLLSVGSAIAWLVVVVAGRWIGFS